MQPERSDVADGVMFDLAVFTIGLAKQVGGELCLYSQFTFPTLNVAVVLASLQKTGHSGRILLLDSVDIFWRI